MDMLFWNADKSSVTGEELIQREREIISKDNWILDGTYLSSLELRLQACDTVFLLDYPLEICLNSVMERIGTSRPDMPWIETEPDPAFIEYIHRYVSVQHSQVLQLLKQYPEKTVITFRNREESRKYLSAMQIPRWENAEMLWEEFCKTAGVPESAQYEAWSFGGNPDYLAQLTLAGIKTATASGFDLYALDADEPLPKPGDYSVILDSSEKAVCVIRTTHTDVIPFCDVGAAHAAREGEGDRSLEYWRKVHWDFFTDEFGQFALQFDAHSRVLCETFEMVYPQIGEKE